MAMPKNTRLRTKFHFGSSMECMYSMVPYGIPASSLIPFDHGDASDDESCDSESSASNTRNAWFRKQVQLLRSKESVLVDVIKSQMPPNTILFPLKDDIVLGRGKPYQSFPGNLKFVEILEDYKDVYHHCKSRTDKTSLSSKLLKVIKDRGMRFLQRHGQSDGMYWEEVTDEVARQKITMSLR
eukprot:CAMPEP_0198128742 /NCGR_PEP_ID=MMETSP1442-20131203/50033_1 /TAXON_ID= /ORGANISM="Craspedostauros australis, Strain CCMP3328" /LENGTH=182 /DNA_ID=CAMNT_0043788963 /DNA_START=24 /DNA_END=569 /DNA_ORIENTATION=+